MEIPVRRPVEQIEIRKYNEKETKKMNELLDRQSQAKSFYAYLRAQYQIIKLKKIGLPYDELVSVWADLIAKFEEYAPRKIIASQITILDGWKGKDKIEVYKGFDNDFRIQEHIKDKESGIVTTKLVEVKKEDLNRIIFIVKGLALGEPVKCYVIAEKLGYANWKDLWKERRQYFQNYYYPIKILEALGVIKYSGRGVITRILGENNT